MLDISGGVCTYSKKAHGTLTFYVNGRKSNFQVKEFACNDGSDTILVDCELVEKLQIIREYFKAPVLINSGYRTKTYNTKIGGARSSQHLLGKAADIVVKGVSPADVCKFAKIIGFRGVGEYKDFTHVDTRTSTSYWKG